jgi:hypothetical protein
MTNKRYPYNDWLVALKDELQFRNKLSLLNDNQAVLMYNKGYTFKRAATVMEGKSFEMKSVQKDTMDSGVELTEDRLLKIYTTKVNQVIAKLDEVGKPKVGETLQLITKRSFNALAFLQWILETEYTVIDEAILVIYSINYQAAQFLNDLIISGKIKTATIVISNLRNQAHREKEEQVKNFFIEAPNVELIFCNTHAKITSFKLGNTAYTITGSGNLSFNSRIEQYTIDNSLVCFEFHKRWIQEIKVFLKNKKELTVYPKQPNLCH